METETSPVLFLEQGNARILLILALLRRCRSFRLSINVIASSAHFLERLTKGTNLLAY